MGYRRARSVANRLTLCFPERHDESVLPIEELEVFVAVAEELHLGRAASRCRMTTSAVSKRLQHLERAVGVRLFDRTSRRVMPTPAAMALIGPARRVLSEVEAFETLAATAATGT